VGGYKHWLQKTVDFRLSAWMGLGSVRAAIFGVYVLHLLEDAFGSEFDASGASSTTCCSRCSRRPCSCAAWPRSPAR
jgi:hypothetical protein